MIVAAINPFCAAAPREVNTEVGASSVHLVRLRIARIDLGLQFVHTDRSFLFLVGVAVSQVLIVPNIVVIVAFDICSIFLQFCYLPAGRFLHPLVHLQLL